ncbi:2'-5' RNA ligase family protein [Micromonospora zamorensis]|uniref:2'-5' RNA ligase family protein n=1 Tax=Micromonospora zamorensis TaxID=709883 RepID=A0ABZ1PJP7_9ACTN
MPLDGLHLTMQGLGFTDDVNNTDVASIVAETRRRWGGLPPLELSLVPVDPDAEGIGLLVRPWNRVEHLRATIRGAIGAVWQTVPEASDGFRPHVTIAYSSGQAPTEPIRTRLNALRHQPPATSPSDHPTSKVDRATSRAPHLPVDKGSDCAPRRVRRSTRAASSRDSMRVVKSPGTDRTAAAEETEHWAQSRLYRLVTCSNALRPSPPTEVRK